MSDSLDSLYQQMDKEKAFKEKMKAKYPGGYTPSQEVGEWGKDPRNRTDLGNWMVKKKEDLYNMIFGKEETNNNGAHGAIDSKISQNNLNPNNIKNQVMSETLDIYDIFTDPVYNKGQAIFTGQTGGGDTRFYNRPFDMPSTYYTTMDEPYSDKDQIMQVLYNAISQSPDDTVSTQSVQDLYGLHKQPMPKYQKGGGVKNDLSDNLKQLFSEQMRKSLPSGRQSEESWLSSRAEDIPFHREPQYFLDKIKRAAEGEWTGRKYAGKKGEASFKDMSMDEWKEFVGMPKDESPFSEYIGMSQAKGDVIDDMRSMSMDEWKEYGYGNLPYPEEDVKLRQSDYYPGEQIMLEKYLSGYNPNPGGIGSTQESFQIPEIQKLIKGFQYPK